MKQRGAKPLCLGLLGLCLLAANARGQGSPMAQGEAAIGVRSDVKLTLKGTHGTPKGRVEQLGKVVGGRLPDVRACYRKLVEKRPTQVGAFVVSIDLSEAQKASLEVEQRGGMDRELRRCVTGALAKAPYAEVEGPAAAIVELEFQNTRAAGQSELLVRRAERAEVDVSVDGSGTASASWQTPDGHVVFAVTGRGDAAEPAVGVAVRGLRDGFASFLDCQRKASRGGETPVGDIDIDLRLSRRGGKAKAKIRSNSVPHKRVPRCIERAFQRTEFDRVPRTERPQVQTQLQIRFRE